MGLQLKGEGTGNQSNGAENNMDYGNKRVSGLSMANPTGGD